MKNLPKCNVSLQTQSVIKKAIKWRNVTLKQGGWECISGYFFSSGSPRCQMHLLEFCIVLTLMNSSKLILPSWSRSPVAIRFSVISLTLYPGRGKQAALNKSFSSLQLMYPLPSVSARQATTWSFRAIRVPEWRGEGKVRWEGRVLQRQSFSGHSPTPGKS